MASMELRQEIIATACNFKPSGLSVGKTGNISARCDEGFIITPTGLPYEELVPDDLVICNLSGEVISGKWVLSSEWPFHAAIYKARNDVNAIVHSHSPYAAGLACSRKSIPAFNYTVVLLGGDSITCADYATFGTEQLAINVVNALVNKNACLLANHGQVTVADTIVNAYKFAHLVEDLAKQYCISLQCGGPVLLDAAEMKVIIEKTHDMVENILTNKVA